MTKNELEIWKQTRTRGQGRFLWKIIWQRCLWFSVPLAATLLLTGFYRSPAGEFWSEYGFLIGAFVGVALLVGVGDGLYLWKLRERDFQHKAQSGAPELACERKAAPAAELLKN